MALMIYWAGRMHGANLMLKLAKGLLAAQHTRHGGNLQLTDGETTRPRGRRCLKLMILKSDGNSFLSFMLILEFWEETWFSVLSDLLKCWYIWLV